MHTVNISDQIRDLRQRLSAVERNALPASSETTTVYSTSAPVGRRMSFAQNRDLDAMGWSEWDYNNLTFDFIGQEIVIPESQFLDIASHLGLGQSHGQVRSNQRWCSLLRR